MPSESADAAASPHSAHPSRVPRRFTVEAILFDMDGSEYPFLIGIRLCRRLPAHATSDSSQPPGAMLTRACPLRSACRQYCEHTHELEISRDHCLCAQQAAVEAAWTSVANELGQPADEVIAATHGRRAIDNLRDLQPKLRRLTNEQMEPHVEDVSLASHHGMSSHGGAELTFAFTGALV